LSDFGIWPVKWPLHESLVFSPPKPLRPTEVEQGDFMLLRANPIRASNHREKDFLRQ
jgi:hypothetical protein